MALAVQTTFSCISFMTFFCNRIKCEWTLFAISSISFCKCVNPHSTYWNPLDSVVAHCRSSRSLHMPTDRGSLLILTLHYPMNVWLRIGVIRVTLSICANEFMNLPGCRVPLYWRSISSAILLYNWSWCFHLAKTVIHCVDFMGSIDLLNVHISLSTCVLSTFASSFCVMTPMSRFVIESNFSTRVDICVLRSQETAMGE